MSVIAKERRELARRKASLARMEEAGLDPSLVQFAIQEAFRAWSKRRPWKWLPSLLRSPLFDVIGTKLAEEYIARAHAQEEAPADG